jgi:hypothetical protein
MRGSKGKEAHSYGVPGRSQVHFYVPSDSSGVRLVVAAGENLPAHKCLLKDSVVSSEVCVQLACIFKVKCEGVVVQCTCVQM